MQHEYHHDPELAFEEEASDATPPASPLRRRGLVAVLAGVAVLAAIGLVVTSLVFVARSQNGVETSGESPAAEPPVSAAPAAPPAPPASAPEPGAAADSTVIGTYGLGPYQLGASADKLVRNGDLAVVQANGCNAGQSTYHEPRGRYSPESVTVEVEDGKVAMVVVTSSAYRTPSGIAVGSTEAKLRATYGTKLTPVPHYAGGSNYLLEVGNSALGFGVGEEGQVGTIAAGDAERVESFMTAADGC